MELGHNFNKYKNGVVFQAESPERLLSLIQQIRCPVEIIQMYHDGKNHVAIVVTEKKLIRKIKVKE